MKLRSVIVFTVIVSTTLAGGLYGFVAGIIFLGFLGAIFPGPQQYISDVEAREEEWDAIIPARRGSEVDPTRPTPEDFRAIKEFHSEMRSR